MLSCCVRGDCSFRQRQWHHILLSGRISHAFPNQRPWLGTLCSTLQCISHGSLFYQTFRRVSHLLETNPFLVRTTKWPFFPFLARAFAHHHKSSTVVLPLRYARLYRSWHIIKFTIIPLPLFRFGLQVNSSQNAASWCNRVYGGFGT